MAIFGNTEYVLISRQDVFTYITKFLFKKHSKVMNRERNGSFSDKVQMITP